MIVYCMLFVVFFAFRRRKENAKGFFHFFVAVSFVSFSPLCVCVWVVGEGGKCMLVLKCVFAPCKMSFYGKGNNNPPYAPNRKIEIVCSHDLHQFFSI